MVDERTPPQGLRTRTEAEGATVDLPEGLGFFTTGQVLGERYEILEMLGRGGMGEVWRAFDLKLRVEVGLKALRDDLFQSERRLELLRQEVRAAREVISPNVCRIFDLIEIDGRELVSMEYVDGATLLGVLQERGPLELKEAQDIASQFLAGLEAIHKAGLVHRDVKPENIMLTRAGRVVVMDFGLARGPESGAGSVSGTPAYMAPEHAAGQEVDARADVYSAGVVLAEMVSPVGIKSYESRQSVWEGIRSEPAEVPDSPWAPVIKRAVTRDRERRQNSAHTLIRELEEVTLRVEGAEDLHPYPGLAPFTETEVEYFFGREVEVEIVWRRLEDAHLLAIVGASGAGKTSFIGAGLTPNAPPGWQIARCTPGNAAVSSLRKMLIHELTGDAEVLELLVDSDSPDSIIEAASRWRKRHHQALLIVDQFEELFTQNPEDEQARFATLVGRLVTEADVRVLLSMRDDFLLHCNRHEELRPLFAALTPLDPPAGGALRRAVMQPALKCGYRFEDDELVEEILSEVKGERGALPLLAFALARLWEKRDRESGLLTRRAYHDTGGVGGALARHAEATVERIGVERIPIVRELFRNLVTAEGTRAVREWEELLSVFEGEKVRRSALPSVASEGLGVSSVTSHSEQSERSLSDSSPARAAAADVLRELIDSRLLTSYEVREDEHYPIRRVEIIHESLLANWPRLVRWQTQDADAVQVREQLRQAARTWDEHDRSDDLLWTGSAYREFSVWHDGYPGGLSETEEAFATAMTVLATRRRRRRQFAATAALLVVAVVSVVFAGLWRRSVREALRAEASRVVTLGQLQLDRYPTAALAHATASLELADTQEARRLAVEALWRGPPARVLPTSKGKAGGGGFYRLALSPDDRWLGVTGHAGNTLLIPHDGAPAIELPHPAMSGPHSVAFTGNSHTLVTFYDAIRLWSVPGGRLLRTIDREMLQWSKRVTGDRIIVAGIPRTDPASFAVTTWSFEDDTRRTLSTSGYPGLVYWDVDASGRWLASIENGSVRLRPLEDLESKGVPLMVADEEIPVRLTFPPGGRHLAVTAESGAVHVLPLPGFPGVAIRAPGIEKPENLFEPTIDPDATMLVQGSSAAKTASLWRLDGAPDADFETLRRGDVDCVYDAAFSSEGSWLATLHESSVSFWPLRVPRVRVFGEVFSGGEAHLYISADGNWLGSCVMTEGARVWPLQPNIGQGCRIGGRCWGLAFHPTRDLWFCPPWSDGPLHLLDFELNPVVRLFDRRGGPPTGVSFDRHGRRLAVGTGWAEAPRDMLLLVFDFETGNVQVLDQLGGQEIDPQSWDPSTMFITETHWAPDGTLYSAGGGGVRRWNLETSTAEFLVEAEIAKMDLSEDGRFLLVTSGAADVYSVAQSELRVLDLEGDSSRLITTHGDTVAKVALDPTGRIIVTGDGAGIVRAGYVDGSEPHLLLGHEGGVTGLAVSPDGRWIFTSAGGEIRQWPMPDLTKPPLHTLPREELIAKLKTLTNLRVVRDPESSTGWKLEIGPFPGWETVPEW